MLKRFSSLIVLSSLLLSQAGIQTVSAARDDDYDDAIEYLLDEDIADGYDDGDFRGYKDINRAEFTKIIMLATGADEDDMDEEDCFWDVRREWFAPFVCEARDEGIVRGYQDGTFRPGNPISFAEAASIIAKAYDADTDTYGEWYAPYIDALEDWDAVPPTVSGVHNPLTREEMAYIIWKVETENDDDDDNDNDDEEIDLSVRSNVSEANTGDTVTFTIEIENNGDEDIELDVEAVLEEGLEFQSAPGHDERNSIVVLWEDVEIDKDDEEELILTVLVLNGYAGKTLTVEVEAGDEEDDADITVRTSTPVSGTDPVLYWNNIALLANAEDATGTYGTGDAVGPGSSSRALAIVQTAVYEAVNSIDRAHQPYIAFIPVQQNETVSMDAAVAAAAYKTLVEMFPRQKSMFDITYQGALFKVPDGAEETAGIRVGEAAAKQILDARKNDGATIDVTYTPGNEPGKHRVDPLNPNQPFMGANWGNVKPFSLLSGTQFRSPPPPALTSKEYADAFNELKLYGGDGITSSTIRTQDQTEIGLFWAYDGVKKIGTPPRLYNQIAQVIAKQKGNTVTQNARLFALINIAMADAGVVCWESKYYYNVWRPIVGIREADVGTGPTGLGDNNPLTTGDVNWTPLGAPMSNMTMNNFTPPFPSYPSGHATFGTAAFTVIEQFYGTNNIGFTFTSDELNGVTTDNKGNVRPLKPRTFQNLDQAIKENADSRVYLGVHWRFDQDEGMRMGEKIAEYVFQNSLKPLN